MKRRIVTLALAMVLLLGACGKSTSPTTKERLDQLQQQVKDLRSDVAGTDWQVYQLQDKVKKLEDCQKWQLPSC